MSGKRRHDERLARRESRAERDRLDAIARGVGVHLPALAPSGSYDQPEFVRRGYYVDEPFVCRDCGLAQVWTAEQQKWWYEVAKGDIFSTATRCRRCRRRDRERRESARVKGKGGDPNPYKTLGLLLARVRSMLEPDLVLAGFQFAGRSGPGPRGNPFYDYRRSDGLLTLTLDYRRGRLAAEWLTEGRPTAESISGGGVSIQLVASVDLSNLHSWTTTAIERRLIPFFDAVRRFLRS